MKSNQETIKMCGGKQIEAESDCTDDPENDAFVRTAHEWHGPIVRIAVVQTCMDNQRGIQLAKAFTKKQMFFNKINKIHKMVALIPCRKPRTNLGIRES